MVFKDPINIVYSSIVFDCFATENLYDSVARGCLQENHWDNLEYVTGFLSHGK